MNALVKTSSVVPFTPAPIGFGPGGPLPSPTPWTQYNTYLQCVGGVVIGNPTGGNLGSGTVNAESYFVNGQPFNLVNYLPVAGGTVTGTLTLNGPVIFGSTVDGVKLDMGTY